MYVQKRYNKNSIKIKNSQFVLIISCLVFLSFPPWFVWSLGEWNMRIISLITLIIALKLLSYSKIKQNILLASLYLISALYMNFGGLNGYTLPNHLEFTVFILLLSLSKNFLLNVLEKFEKIVTVVFILGIITYLIGLIIELPSFSISPLNLLKNGIYKVHIFDLQLIDYNFGDSKRFMSVFDEPGVVGTLVALLLSYRRIEFNKIKDIVFIAAGLLSFSLAFYIIFFINLLYNKVLNLKFYFVLIVVLFGLYYLYPDFVKVAVFDRFIVANNIGIVNNRATESFQTEYDHFVKKGGEALLFGLGPNALTDLSNEITLNVSSYETLVYSFGIVGCLIFISFFFYATYKFAPTRRGWFFFIVFLALAWQRPGVFDYFNLLIFLGGLSYISIVELQQNTKNKFITLNNKSQ
jgi:hypothetical protein